MEVLGGCGSGEVAFSDAKLSGSAVGRGGVVTEGSLGVGVALRGDGDGVGGGGGGVVTEGSLGVGVALRGDGDGVGGGGVVVRVGFVFGVAGDGVVEITLSVSWGVVGESTTGDTNSCKSSQRKKSMTYVLSSAYAMIKRAV